MSYRGEERGVVGTYADLSRRVRMLERISSRVASTFSFALPLFLDPETNVVSLPTEGASATTFLRGDGRWASPSGAASATAASAGVGSALIIFSLEAPDDVIGSWTPSAEAVLSGGVARSDDAPGQEWTYSGLTLQEGTWEVALVHEVSPNGGIASISVGDDEVDFDTYAAVPGSDVRSVASVTASGQVDVLITNPTSNDASSGSLLSLQALALRRT